ncbi:MAG: insulinase family protein, partial [Flavobacteriaceae bacterium]|nr:insulinase family protein [Flavobacteriaceae bacterium]
MKTKIVSLILLFLLSISVTAQVDRSQQPKSGPAPKISLGKPKTFELKNGLKVLVVENHKLPRVSVSLAIDNPPVFEAEKAG